MFNKEMPKIIAGKLDAHKPLTNKELKELHMMRKRVFKNAYCNKIIK